MAIVRREPPTPSFAYSFIQTVVGVAETSFIISYKKPPSLFDENDYLLLADLLDVRAVGKQYDYVTGEEQYPVRRDGIENYDIAYVLLRRFLQREGFFHGYDKRANKLVFDGLMGRLCYNVPMSEYEFRIAALIRLQELQTPFPPDFTSFLGAIKGVGKACRLLNLPATAENIEKFSHIADWMSNPTVNYYELVRSMRQMHPEELSFATFAIEWQSYIERQQLTQKP
ncbi:MAG: hypothetical protein HY617_02805 [Candidatus Sungbacteria bacterium]|nr:hypothetical protein [Candidatus Sungbacteria bacterium]